MRVWWVKPFEVKDLFPKLDGFLFVSWCLGGAFFFGTLQ